MSEAVVYMIGHGERSLDAILGLLGENQIATLVDIRQQPQHALPAHFTESVLREALDRQGITYHWAGRQLGNHFSPSSGTVHGQLPESLRGFAAAMQGEGFIRAIRQICSLAKQGRMAIFSSELQADNCHRRLIADYLLLEAVQVVHIVDTQNVVPHLLSPEARRESATLIYDRRS